MRTFGFVGVAAVALLALPLTAQVEGNQRVMRVFAGGRYQSPLCPLKGDFRTSSAGIRRPKQPASVICSLRPMDEKCVRPRLRLLEASGSCHRTQRAPATMDLCKTVRTGSLPSSTPLWTVAR